MAADRAALQAMLVGMRGEYARKLPESLARIESLWSEVACGGASRGEELLRAVHSIAGAAATFGLPQVGEAALELEHALGPMCASGATPDASQIGRIADGISQLLRISRAAMVGGGKS